MKYILSSALCCEFSTRKIASWTSAANIDTLMTVTEASIKWGYFIKIWVGYFKIQGEINLVNTVEPGYNERGLYQIHCYRTLVSDHKSTLWSCFALLISRCFLKKPDFMDHLARSWPLHYAPFNFKFNRSTFYHQQRTSDTRLVMEKNSNNQRR